jgi:hypothetical protein
VFHVPDDYVELDLVAVIMPFSKEFDPMRKAIMQACTKDGLHCLRADDIWEGTTIIQDIFTLIFRAQVVIVDFSGKNANVMYETGIAHTLGKHVIPVTQSLADVPFDMTRKSRIFHFESGLDRRCRSKTRLRQLARMSEWPAMCACSDRLRGAPRPELRC